MAGSSSILTLLTLVVAVVTYTGAQTLSTGFLLYPDLIRNNIYVMDLEGRNESAYFGDGLQRTQSVDFDRMRELLFVLERGTTTKGTRKIILTTDLDVTNVNQRRFLGSAEPIQLSIDSNSELIYYADRGQNLIGVYSYDLRYRETLFYIQDPGGVVVDFSVGQIFYNTYGRMETPTRVTRIYTANGDGSNPKILIDERGVIFNLALDYTARMIYWVGDKVIERCSYTGTNRQLLIDETADNLPFAAVAVDDTYIYYSVMEARYLYRTLKSGAGKQMLGPGIQGNTFITDLHVYKPGLEITDTNQCSVGNGGCSHMCLPTPTGRTCLCDWTYRLAADQMTCILSPFEKILLVTDRERSAIFVIDVTTNATYPWRLIALVAPVGIGWNRNQGDIILADQVHNELISDCWDRREDCNKGIKKWNKGEHTLEDAEIDYSQGYTYIVDSASQIIFRITLTGTVQQTIVNVGRGSPRALALDLTRRLVFWTDIGNPARIERASMDDGSDRVILIDSDIISPNDIVVDPDMRLMYWCDGGKRVIEVASMTGGDRKVLFNESYVFISLALDDNHLYFFARIAQKLFRIDRWTGGNKVLMGDESFIELYDMTYVDINASTSITVNPPLPPPTSTSMSTSTAITTTRRVTTTTTANKVNPPLPPSTSTSDTMSTSIAITPTRRVTTTTTANKEKTSSSLQLLLSTLLIVLVLRLD